MGQIQREDVLRLRDHMVKLCEGAEERASHQALQAVRRPEKGAAVMECQQELARMDAFIEFKDNVLRWIGQNWPT